MSATVIVALLALPHTTAGFTDTEVSSGNTWGSDTMNAPTALTATGGTTVDLSWTATPDTYADGHRIYRSTSSGGPYIQIAQLTPRSTTSYTDSPAGGTYYYVIRGYFGTWESPNSNEATATSTTTVEDNDGVAYVSDNCPNRFNIDQYDTDNDGLGDACDSSPVLLTTASFVTTGQSLDAGNSFGVASGDFDGDGDLDLAYANNGPNTVWLNNGTGTFVDTGQSLGVVESFAIASGDLDGDGDLDLTVANKAGNTVWLNNGAGTFIDSGQSLGLQESWRIVLGDTDSDGDLDLVVGNKAIDSVWLNNGTGVFTDSGQSLNADESRGLAIGDLDGDYDLDVVNGGKNLGQIWTNDGSGTYAFSGQTTAGHDAAAFADFDGDGDLDLAHGVRGGASNTIWLNNGSGTFTDTGQNLIGDEPGLAPGDFDGDGDIDLAFANSADNTILLNDGSGTFTDSGQLLDPANSRAVVAADFDGDGDLDLAYANLGANTVWMNEPTPGLTYAGIGPSSTRTSGGSLTVAMPSGTSLDDLLLLVEVNAANQTITTPSGWTLAGDAATQTPSQFRFTVWWKLAAAAEPSVTLPVNTNSSGATAWVIRYANPAGYPPVPIVATAATSSGIAGPATTATPTPDVTTNAADATVISIVAIRDANTLSLSTPQGFSLSAMATQSATGQARAIGIADVVEPTSGNTPLSPTWSQTGTAAQWAWVTLAFS